MYTLSDYRVPWHHVNTIDNRQAISPTTELDRYILKQMCILYSGGIQEQCACEYWSDGREARVTEIYKLSLAQKNNLRLKNLNCERYLVKLVRDIGISVFCDTSLHIHLNIPIISSGLYIPITVLYEMFLLLSPLTKSVEVSIFQLEDFFSSEYCLDDHICT